MESILISIRPEWCELILAGKKTIEIRKTMPKLKTPFKCYIYETKGIYMPQLIDSRFKCQGVGKVIGEFICDNIECFGVPYPAFQSELDKRILEESCLTYYQLHRYAYHDALYGWHISQLKVYDEPKGLWEFCRNCNQGYGADCKFCKTHGGSRSKMLQRPPQSWFYVEECV